LVALSGQPYEFTAGDPVNGTDPSGLYFSGGGSSDCNSASGTLYCTGATPNGVSVAGSYNHSTGATTGAFANSSFPKPAPTNQGNPEPQVTPTITTPTDFANALLVGVNVPDSQQNVEAIVAWELAEGGNWKNDANFNPLSTTFPYDGSYSINYDKVQSYHSWADGLYATESTLKEGYYVGIISALRNDNDAAAVAQAEAATPWGTPNFSNLIGVPYNG
jgi:hypothetical protein